MTYQPGVHELELDKGEELEQQDVAPKLGLVATSAALESYPKSVVDSESNIARNLLDTIVLGEN